MRQHSQTTNQSQQIAYLSQELTEHITQASNLIMRSKYELDRIHQVTKMLLTVHEEREDSDGLSKVWIFKGRALYAKS